MQSQNAKALKKHYPDLFKQLNTPAQELTIEMTGGHPNIHYEGRYLHSRFNPLQEASRWVEGIEIEEDMDAIFIVGIGLGYYLHSLRATFKEHKLILIEPDVDVFKLCLETTDISSFIEDENIVLLIGKDPNVVKVLIDFYYSQGKIKKVHYTQLPVYGVLYKEYIEEIYSQLKKVLKLSQANVATDIFFVDQWLENVIRNMKYLPQHQHVGILKDKFKNKPVVIVAAGPSLEKQFDLLRENQDKMLIVAVGTAAGILDRHGIRAHIFMGLDGNDSEAKIFKEIKSKDALFIYAHMIHHEAVESYDGPKMWFVPEGDHRITELCKRLKIDSASIVSGGSIAHTALAFCDWLECGPIMLIGQDLAYTNNQLYAPGAANPEDGMDKRLHILEKDIYGNPIYTKQAFLDFRNWFEDYIKYRMEGKVIYNCTEGGLNIKGAQNEKFSEIISEKCQESTDFIGIIDEVLADPSTEIKEKFDKKIPKLRKSLEELMDLSVRRIDKLAELLRADNFSNQAYKLRFDDILKTTKEFEKNEFYKIFIAHTGKIYQTAMNRVIHQNAEAVEVVDEKKRILLTGLLQTYVELHRYIIISKEAMDSYDAK